MRQLPRGKILRNRWGSRERRLLGLYRWILRRQLRYWHLHQMRGREVRDSHGSNQRGPHLPSVFSRNIYGRHRADSVRQLYCWEKSAKRARHSLSLVFHWVLSAKHCAADVLIMQGGEVQLQDWSKQCQRVPRLRPRNIRCLLRVERLCQMQGRDLWQ